MVWIETVMGLLSFVGVGLFVYNLIADRKDGDAEDKDDDDVTNFEKLQYLKAQGLRCQGSGTAWQGLR